MCTGFSSALFVMQAPHILTTCLHYIRMCILNSLLPVRTRNASIPSIISYDLSAIQFPELDIYTPRLLFIYTMRSKLNIITFISYKTVCKSKYSKFLEVKL